MHRFARIAAALAVGLLAAAAAAVGRAEEGGAVEAAPRSALVADWMLQDGKDLKECFASAAGATQEIELVGRALKELGPDGAALGGTLEQLKKDGVPGGDPRWTDLYAAACENRRAGRLKRLAAKFPRIVFTKHYNLGGSHYAYTEGQSDAQAERQFRPGSALCLLDLGAAGGPRVRTLIDDPKGVIRDPDVSYDGRRVAFAWKRSERDDDYHLYELAAETGEVRPLTFGLGFADYEPAYLPDGGLVFSSTRCVQIVDCWWTEVSNLYTCDADGRFLRRLGFDQVHTNFPQVLDDGRLIYTRWEYNDRGQVYVQPLFQMNPDGTGQTEFYGNNSWFPTTILHARGIPGTQKVIGILSGHHCLQKGKLAILDPGKGQEEAAGVQLIAPVRETKAVHVDAYGQDGEQFQYPYPVSETEFVVAYAPAEAAAKGNLLFGLYWMAADGRRELLASDPKLSCNQAVPLAPRPRPPARPSTVDYRKNSGVFYVKDVHVGPGLEGIARGTVKSLRVVTMDFRAAGIGENGSGGPAGGALSSTPPSCRNGCWDPKIVLGSTPVYEDGSAMLTVPARTPVYFQLVDAKGEVVQSMRSWSTLQPGETFSCVGCHEKKSEAAGPESGVTIALRRGAQALEPFYGPPRGFSFAREVQPILDKHCTGCHDARDGAAATGKDHAFSLLDTRTPDPQSKRMWSDAYLALTKNGTPNKMVNWLNVQSIPPMLPPYYRGAARSDLAHLAEKGHYGVKLGREETDRIACWIDLLVPFCGDYTEANAWNDNEIQRYAHFIEKRGRMAAMERRNVEALLAAQAGEAAAPAPPDTYRNVALNPADVQGPPAGYPHASSNSEYGNQPCFAARCAIDGRTANKGHGDAFPSWGPDKRKDLWWRVEFGRAVEVDKVVLHIRADFPHDAWWREATIEFSDGSREKIRIEKTADPQAFVFRARAVTGLKLTNLVQDEPLGWCALTEVEVWGHDAKALMHLAPLAF